MKNKKIIWIILLIAIVMLLAVGTGYLSNTNKTIDKPTVSELEKYADVRAALMKDGWEVYIPAGFVSTNDKDFPEIGDCGRGYDAVCSVSFRKEDLGRSYVVQIGGRAPYGPYLVWTVIDMWEYKVELPVDYQIITTDKYIIKSSYISIVIIDPKDTSKLIKVIALENIPPYDFGNDGQESKPETDYYFDVNTVIDNFGETLFFSVNNHETAGNANAERALFSYNIETDKLTMLKVEFGTSFGSLFPSADGKYLVYSVGNHGGVCYNIYGLGVYDLENNKDLQTADTLLYDGVGIIKFDHWVDSSSFVYKEETYNNVEECRDDAVPMLSDKTYYIKN